MERVLTEGGGTQWYQLYVWRDAEAALVTVARARDAGFEALVLTVNSPTYNNREFDIRNGANFPPRVTLRSAIDGVTHPRWLFGTLGRYVLAEGRLPRFPNIHFPPEAASEKDYTAGKVAGFMSRNDKLDWDFLLRLRDLWPRPLIVKGILHPDDAVKAAACGADGIIVSNHAGNVLDAAAIPVEMLPHIAAAAGQGQDHRQFWLPAGQRRPQGSGARCRRGGDRTRYALRRRCSGMSPEHAARLPFSMPRYAAPWPISAFAISLRSAATISSCRDRCRRSVRRKAVLPFHAQTKRARSPSSNANAIDDGTSRPFRPKPRMVASTGPTTDKKPSGV